MRFFFVLKANLHSLCHALAVLCRANSHTSCCDPAVLRQCHALRGSPRVAGRFQTANRETPRGSRKKPNLSTSPTCRRETPDFNSHIPCRAPAVLCRYLEKSLAKRHGRSKAGARHGELAFRVSGYRLLHYFRLRCRCGTVHMYRIFVN